VSWLQCQKIAGKYRYLRCQLFFIIGFIETSIRSHRRKWVVISTATILDTCVWTNTLWIFQSAP